MSTHAEATAYEQEALTTPPSLGMRPHLWALLGYFALALIVTYPLILHFTTGVPGDLIADRDQNLWNLWWVGQAASHFTNPFHTDLLYYPYGVDLYYHTLALPLGIIGLVPQALVGLPAAYNTVVLAAFTLSGYGAFRLGLLFTDKPLAAFLGGMVFAFTPYTLDALKGQTEVLSVQWIPLYAEAWLRAQGNSKQGRYATFAGIFLALALLSSLYYGLYLILFTLAHGLYTLVTSPDRRAWLSRITRVVALVAGVTFVLTLPLLVGLVRDRGDPRLAVLPTKQQRLDNSADLLSFFLPPHDHPFLGTVHTQPGVNTPPLHPYLTLGYIALALAITGAVVGWRGKRSRFWVGLAVVAAVLAMGPQLQVGRNVTGIPLPFKLLEWLPGWDGMAKIERLVVLVRLCLSVLAVMGGAWVLKMYRPVNKSAGYPVQSLPSESNGNPPILNSTHLATSPHGRTQYGIARTFMRHAKGRRALVFAALLSLLLFELPIHPRDMEPLDIPAGFQTLASQNAQSALHTPQPALIELPFATKQAETLGRRMLYQTAHGLPIMGGYLARSYTSPITDECAPFWGFISAAGILHRPDIGTPTLESRPLDVLRFYNISSLALYNTYGGPDDEPLESQEEAAFLDIIAQVSTGQALYKDSYVSLYSVDPTRPVDQTPAFHIGNGWHDPETSGGVPFRWMSGNGAAICVFTPQPLRAALTMQGTSFGQERTATISIGDTHLYSGKVSTGGTFTPIQTAIVSWSAGITEVQISADGAPVTPRSLDPKQKDNRPLTVGVKGLKLEVTP